MAVINYEYAIGLFRYLRVNISKDSEDIVINEDSVHLIEEMG